MTDKATIECCCPKIPYGYIEVNWLGKMPICVKCGGVVVSPKPKAARVNESLAQVIRIDTVIEIIPQYENDTNSPVCIHSGELNKAFYGDDETEKETIMEAFSRVFQFIIFPIIGLIVVIMAAVMGAALVIGKYAVAGSLLYRLFH